MLVHDILSCRAEELDWKVAQYLSKWLEATPGPVQQVIKDVFTTVICDVGIT